jgi:hypothetical protein
MTAGSNVVTQQVFMVRRTMDLLAQAFQRPACALLVPSKT